MAYNQELAERIRRLTVADHMCCGVLNEDLVVRVGPDRYTAALAQPAVRPMDFTGKPLKGMVYIGPAGPAARQPFAAQPGSISSPPGRL